MARRQELLSAMGSGGTTAPTRKGRRRSARAKERQGSPLAAAAALAERVAKKSGMRRLPAGGLPTSGPVNPSPGAARTGIGGQAIGQQRRAVRRSPSTSGPSIAPAAQPGLGRQLSRRVASGEIDQAQAQRTAKERRELEGAYGSDWREVRGCDESRESRASQSTRAGAGKSGRRRGLRDRGCLNGQGPPRNPEGAGRSGSSRTDGGGSCLRRDPRSPCCWHRRWQRPSRPRSGACRCPGGPWRSRRGLSPAMGLAGEYRRCRGSAQPR
jgi:hypothetical protein